jgi:hypothetical protein
MNHKNIVLCLFAAFSMASVVAHAAHALPDPSKPSIKYNSVKFNGFKLNGPGLILQGAKFNGFRMNGPGLILQGRTLNGFWLNGPGLILQGKLFNGFSLNGLGYQLLPVSSDTCAAPQPALVWPLSALKASHVKVRLATR